MTVAGAPVEHDSYAVAQGTTCTVVDPVTNETQNASKFYDYRNPHTDITGNPASDTFSSFGTQEFQKTSTSVMLFYEGSDGANLVLVHDRLGDNDGGSTLTMTLDGLPADGEWVVQDDEYPGRDDEWDIGETTTSIDWKWAENRTDGGVYSGIGNHSGTITITPEFNEDADAWGDWGHSGSDEYRLEQWILISADGTERELDRDRQVFIHGGGCEETPPSAAVTSPSTAEAGTNITLDASGTTDDGTIGGYEWDFDGDGSVDAVTTEPTVQHAFNETGNYTVRVTPFDTYGNGDTANTTVEVTEPATPPNASLDAPAETTVNESVTFDASNSTDEGSITSYEWDFDGDGTVDATTTGPTVEYTYNESGEYSPTVTVVDDDGEAATATSTISVLPPNQPPNASLDAPDAVDENESVTLDASASTDDREIVTYRWDVDGDGTVETETADPTLQYTYQDPGNVTAEVTVVDSDGATDSANATITVRDVDTPPTASLNAPESVSVNESVTFDASDSTDDQGIRTYLWDFNGDGTVDRNGSDPVVEFAYPDTGEYNATVTVVDENDQRNTANATVTVVESDNLPSASLTAPSQVTVNESVTLNASGSSDDEGIVSYRWDFDNDGSIDVTTESATVSHTFTEAGSQTVRVVVVDTNNQTDEATTTVKIGDPDAASAAISVQTSDPTAGETVSFDASQSIAASAIATYDWDFGDGGSGSGVAVNNVYSSAGSYEVSLTITTEGGVTTTTTTTISVSTAPSDGDDGSDGGGDDGTSGGDDDDGNDGTSGGNDDDDNNNNAGSGGGNSGGSTGGSSGAAGGSGNSGSADETDQVEEDPGEPNMTQANVSLSAQRMLVGETLVVEATVSNTGDGPGTKTVEFEVEDEMVEEREIPLAPNETRTVTFSYQFNSPGNKTIEVDHGEKRYVTVVPREPDINVVNLRIDQNRVEAGETFTVTAVLENSGDADGEHTVEFNLFGETAATKTVSVPMGESVEVSLTREILAAGSYELTVENESVTVEVVDTSTATPPSPTETNTNVFAPGFGWLTTLVALLLVGVLARRRRV